MKHWYKIQNELQLDTPSLLIFKERAKQNISKMIEIAGDSERLYAHVKTNKMPEVVKMMLAAGIAKFKCATIAEAEMAIMAGAKNVVIAHQLMGYKLDRLIALSQKYSDVFIASLIDCTTVADEHERIFQSKGLTSNVFLDVNNGMDRSGHPLDDTILGLYHYLHALSHLRCHGLHVYDGHLRTSDFETRKQEINAGFIDIQDFIEAIVKAGLPNPLVIAGGTPSFTSHALRNETYCSPGTCVLWDWGYGDKLPEQPFEYAALLLTRVISKPQKGIITVDMGHKAVAAENPTDKRVRFLNLENYELLGQSEEHGVIRVQNWENIKVGDILYGVPYHVCPTINLYDEAYIVENHRIVAIWQVLGRKRRISI